MRLLILACLPLAIAAPGHASSLSAQCRFNKTVSAEIPFDRGAPTVRESDADMVLTISDENFEDTNALLIGNNGSSPVFRSAGAFAVSYTEEVVTGAVTVITIYTSSAMPSGSYAAVHVRTTTLAPPDMPGGSAIASLMTGECYVERR